MKAQRHELEDGTVARAEQSERGEEERRREPEGRQARNAEEKQGHGSVEYRQHADAALAVGEQPADRPHEAAREHAERGEVASGDLAHPVLVVEEDAEKARQADEAAEGDAVEEAEPERVELPQQGGVVAEAPRRRLARAVPGAEEEDDGRDRHRHRREPHRRAPTERRGQPRHEERGEHGARVPRTRDPHGEALVLRRIPA